MSDTTRAATPRRSARWARRAVVATVLPVGLVAAAGPAHADPGGDPRANAVPSSGSTPVATAPLVFPPPRPQPARPPATAVGPLAEQIIAQSDAAQRLGEQAKALQDELAAAHELTETARVAWELAADALAATQSFGDQVGASEDGTAVDPSPAPTISPLPTTSPAATEADAVANRAELANTARQARTALDEAIAAEQDIAGRYAVVLEQFQWHVAALKTLTSRNSDQLAAAQGARDAYEESLAASRGPGTSVAGLQSAPAAQAAVAFALSQLGKPYVWATQGPDTYDCSGLVLASYLSVGIKLPRVANNQYGAGKPVLASQLLPGDLLFFSTDPRDWRQIHHVAIYIGHGKMVHAPTFGDVVKVSPVWWTEYFGATRMVAAVAVPGTTTPNPSPSTSGSPEPSDTATPSPDATPSDDPASPSPTPTGSPVPSTQWAPTTPAPTPTPSPTPSPTAGADSTVPPATAPASSPVQQPRRRRSLTR